MPDEIDKGRPIQNSDVLLDKTDVWVFGQMGDVGGRSGDPGVDDDHPVSPGQQQVREMGSPKPAPPVTTEVGLGRGAVDFNDDFIWKRE